MFRTSIIASTLAVVTTGAQAEATLIETIPGLPGVESLLHDDKRNVFYATLQAGDDAGDGSIVTISSEGIVGNVIASGLENPKGMGLVNDHLVVGDMGNILELDLTSGEVKRHAVEGAEFLNDVAVDAAGDVFVSDMFTSEIYRASDGEVSRWMQAPELENPNGLLFVEGNLFVAAWGAFDDANPIEAPFGNFLKIDPETQEITAVSHAPLGNLDGLQLDGQGNFLISDWKQGAVFRVAADGAAEEIIDLPRGAGDILYDIDADRLYVPMALDGEVRVYSLN